MTVDAEAVAGRLRTMLAGRTPRLLLTLGSGLGGLVDAIDDPLAVPFADVGLPGPSVPGHAGRLVAGTLAGVEVLVQQGRVHLYEGLGPEVVTACVRAAAAVGVGGFVVTNAAGGLRADLTPGDLLVITDHLNLTGTTSLVGPDFVDMAAAYHPAWRAALHEAAAAQGERLVDGVYAGLRGPAYETPAEVRMLRTLGADAVGMSTVLEVLAARSLGLRVLGCSVITNVHRVDASGEGAPTAHGEVLDMGATAGPRLAKLLAAALPTLELPEV